MLLGMDAGQILAVIAEGDVEAAVLARFRLEHFLIWNFARLGGQSRPFQETDRVRGMHRNITQIASRIAKIVERQLLIEHRL